MTYLDSGATSFRKPKGVFQAVQTAMTRCANPGRGGYRAAMAAAETVYRCRERAAAFFDCHPEQVVFTSNCTHGLNIALGSLVKAGDRVVISGFEHNAVTRTLRHLGAEILVAGRKLFDWDECLSAFERALRKGVDAAVFTHVSNVFGYILPVEELSKLCRSYGVPFVMDAAQSAGTLPVSFGSLGAEFIAMPGHKGLLGPQGTGILLCAQQGKPLMAGGTGSNSRDWQMPEFLPDRLEAGTLNVPGIAGLDAGISYLQKVGIDSVFRREHRAMEQCVRDLRGLGYRVFAGEHQASTVSFLTLSDCESFAQELADRGIAVRAGLHCAPLAHESAGTLETGTVRVSFGWDASYEQNVVFRQAIGKMTLS